ncbi:MAG: DUF3450 domain-containing protein [Panacagrimonas sp.]
MVLRALVPMSLLVAMLVPQTGLAQDKIGSAIQKTQGASRAAAASQGRIDRLDDQIRQMLERYRAASWEAQQLTVYAEQLEELTQSQEGEKQSLRRQLDALSQVEQELLPLMLRMIEGLEAFVDIDMPFLQSERKERLDNLKRLMADSEALNSEKFRRILEAYQIESDYGRSLGSERGEVQGRAVDILRVGRVAMYYLTLDGREAGHWNAGEKAWKRLPSAYTREVRRGLRIARETTAPGLLELPVAAAEPAS